MSFISGANERGPFKRRPLRNLWPVPGNLTDKERRTCDVVRVAFYLWIDGKVQKKEKKNLRSKLPSFSTPGRS